ncbi:MAG: CDP-glycerol glycerophosphotransferase family protein [Candidatus Bathyarchaeota archaeon]|nr:CDP-glycerol glycerophosphotransferase family protein [Candidatus Bathyarchaeota archaeon]
MNAIYSNNEKLIRWINQWSNLKVTRGRNIKEILAYSKISLWWFYQQHVYSDIKAMSCITSQSSTDYILKCMMNRFGKLFLFAKTITRFAIGNLLMKKRSWIDGKTNRIMIIGSNWVDAHEPMSKSPKQDSVFGNLIKRCGMKYNIIALDQDIVVASMQLLDLRKLFEKARYNSGLWKTVESFMTFGVLSRIFKHSQKFKRIWKELYSDPDFIDSLNFNDLNLFRLLKPTFDHLAKYVTFNTILYTELLRKAVNVEKPDLILISDEYSIIGKAATLAGKLAGIPTLAMQHGIIYSHHAGYIHFPSEISVKASVNYTLIPDKTAVYGEYAKDVLTKYCDYPNDTVEVTGQPRYDILAKAEEIFDKKRFLKDHKLDFDKKIVLLITQNRSTSEKFLRIAINSLKTLKNVQTIIKPHPCDSEKWHRKVLQEEGYSALILNPKANTSEALFACDLVATVSSTVTIEAMILNKPVVIIDLVGHMEPMGYVESGVALGAYDEKDVALTIRKALFDEKTRVELEINMNEFVEYHLHDVGNATKNVLGLIKEMVGE